MQITHLSNTNNIFLNIKFLILIQPIPLSTTIPPPRAISVSDLQYFEIKITALKYRNCLCLKIFSIMADFGYTENKRLKITLTILLYFRINRFDNI